MNWGMVANKIYIWLSNAISKQDNLKMRLATLTLVRFILKEEKKYLSTWN